MTDFTMTEHLMETSDVARAMGCNVKFVRRLLQSGLLPCIRFGRKNKVLYSRFVAFLHEYDGCDLYEALHEAERHHETTCSL